uniref:Ovule protein n=1 Tax=Heterorhabditis bacteriophora TaxID=37862 RepID=A0A1I7WZ08_HETBA
MFYITINCWFRSAYLLTTEEGISSITSYSTPKKIADDERLQVKFTGANLFFMLHNILLLFF